MVKQQISRFFKDPMDFSRTFKALNFDFQIQGLSRTFKVHANLRQSQVYALKIALTAMCRKYSK